MTRQRRAAGNQGDRDFGGYIDRVLRKNPPAFWRLIMVIVDLETKEENRQLRREAALARARHRRSSRRVVDRGRW